MAKEIKYTTIDEPITSITTPWSRMTGENTAEGYAGTRVEAFIKEQLRSRAGAAYFDPSENRVYYFMSEADKETWLQTGDKQLVVSHMDMNFSGTLYQIKISNSAGVGTMYVTTTQESALLTLSAASQSKSITGLQWADFAEDHMVTVSIDRGATGLFTPIVTDAFLLDGKSMDVDVRKYLATGANRVKVSVTGVISGYVSNAVYPVYLTAMYLAPSNLDWHTPFVEGEPYSLGGMNIGGALDKTLHVRVSGQGGYEATYEKHIGMATYVTNAYAFDGMDFPSAGTGVYDVECRVSAGELETEPLRCQIMCVSAEDRNTAQLVAVNNVAVGVDNYTEARLFDYAVYNGRYSTGSVHVRAIVTVDGEESVTVADEEHQDVACMAQNSYTLPLEVESEEPGMVLQVEIGGRQLSWNVDNTKGFPATAGAVFYLNPASRSNASADRESIVNTADRSKVTAKWTGMSWVDGTDGWTVDGAGRRCLLIPAGASCEIGYQPFASFRPSAGVTIEATYRIANSSDYDSGAISIADRPGDSDYQGLVIKPKSIGLHSANLKDDLRQGYQTMEGETVHMLATISPNYKGWSGVNVAQIYVNGVKKVTFAYTASDMWTLFRDIVIGSASADTYLYKLRVYNKGLSATDAMRNFVNSLGTTAEKAAAAASIESVVDENYRVDYDRVNSAGQGSMVIEMLDGADLPAYGKGKSYKARANIRIRIRPGWVLVIQNVEIEGQGTTSMNYKLWNLRWRLDKCSGWVAWYEDDEGNRIADVPDAGKNAVWLDRYGSGHVAVQRITAKKNYASSMQSHKMGATAAFNDLHHDCVGDNESGGRVAVWQDPCYGFLKKQVEGTQQYTYEFIGLYTIGPDKGDKNTFGYSTTEVKDSVIHLEGTDHSANGVGFDYPYSELEYVDEKEALCVKGTGSAVFEVGANPQLLETEFRPAYEAVYDNSTMLLNVSETLEQINADVEAFRKQKTAEGHEYSRYDVYTNGVYDLYYYNTSEGRYKATGINLLTDLGMSMDSIEGLGTGEVLEQIKAARRERFRSVADGYWDVEDNLFEIGFLLVIGATDNFKKNKYPYKMKLLADGGRWRSRQDDLDTIMPIDNLGLATKAAFVELFDWTDAQKVAYVFKGEDSRLIRLMVESYAEEFMAMLRKILAAMARRGAEYNGAAGARNQFRAFFDRYFFDRAQKYFTKSAYNADAECAYEEAYPPYKNGTYVVDVNPLAQSKGDAYEMERQWTDERMLYMASLCHYGPFATSGNTDSSYGLISMRTQSPQQLTLTPAVAMYPAVLEGQTASKHGARTMAGETAVMPAAGGTNTNLYIVAADWLEDIGDLSQVVIDGEDLSITGKRLRRIKVGDEEPTAIRNVMTGMSVGDCPCVEEVDARNLSTLVSGNIDLRGCGRLRSAWFDGTGVKGVTVRDGCRIESLHLPRTITSLQLVNLSQLTDLFVADVENLTYLRIENTPGADAFGMLRWTYAERTDDSPPMAVRLVGFEADCTAADLTMLAQMVSDEHFTGIDAQGNQGGNVPVIEGTIRVEHAYSDDIAALQQAYGEALVIIMTGEAFMSFADKEVEKIIATKYGDGTGITLTQARAVKQISSEFNNNTEIRTFDEFGAFGGDAGLAIGYSGFRNCKGLTSIDLSNVVEIYSNTGSDSSGAVFYKCGELKGTIRMPRLQKLGGAQFTSIFQECGIEIVADLGSITSTPGGWGPYGVFYKCPELRIIVLPQTLTTIGSYGNLGSGCPKLETVVVYAPVPPTLGDSAVSWGSTVRIYVPDASVEAYKTATGWTKFADRILALSELPEAVINEIS